MTCVTPIKVNVMLIAASPVRRVALSLAIALVFAACGPESVRFQPPPSSTPGAPATDAPSMSPSAAPTTDVNAACACWPLTGKPLEAGNASRRPLVVKVDNVPVARPHYGITQADIVVEEIVEGYVTRLAAIYQSNDPSAIGGVRSARLADRSLTTMVRGALVYSGTSDYAWSLISQDAASGRYVELSADHSDGYYRVPFRIAPYNMFTTAQAQRDALARLNATTVSVPSWPFLAAGTHDTTTGGMVGAVPAVSLAIPYREDTSAVRYDYDAATHTYARWQNSNGKPVRDVDAANNTPVAATNVVVIQTEIWEVDEIVDASGAHAHDMRLTGSGRAIVFRDGLRQEATWSRKDDSVPFTFTSASGEQTKLDPGQTWVHIIPTEWVVSSK